MISLVGEQPAPNLLPIGYFQPTRVALVHTSLPQSQVRAKRLAGLIEGKRKIRTELWQTDAYRVEQIRDDLKRIIDERQLLGHELVFNLTGGTKPMALAAYETARMFAAKAFYYQTEDNQSLIHPYRFDEDGQLIAEQPLQITETLTLDDFLRVYVGDYESNPPKEDFERMVVEALRNSDLADFEILPSVHLKELSGNVEVDALARQGNRLAAFEIKRTAAKRGIDQLNGVTDQRTLGTYTRKILVSATPLEGNNQELAQAYRIRVVVLESGKSGALSETDRRTLIESVRDELEPKR
jgi:hypothetical protein